VDEQEFIEATIIVHRNLADAISNYIAENITEGIELEDSSNSELVSIKFYVLSSASNFHSGLKRYLSGLAEIHNSETPKLSERKVKSKDWEEAYRLSIEPIYINDRIVVRPPWGKISRQVKFEIIIEPKMAFGTGHHETTRACLKLIHQYFRVGQRLLDFGCGTGILAILAGKMGASYIKAVDYDPIAVANTEENFEINEINSASDIVLGSFEKTAGEQEYDMVCANLRKKDLVENFSELVDLITKEGYLMLSGLLEQDQNEIEKNILSAGLETIEFIHDGDWLTYLVQK
jgi:ribosomal protein L11 methyltransferase